MRNNILDGNLPLPSIEKFQSTFPSEVVTVMEQLWQSLWHNYCAKTQGTSSLYWLERLGPINTTNYLSALKGLQDAGWIRMDTRDNYSSIHLCESKLFEFVTEEELLQVRFNKRFLKYLPYTNTSTQSGRSTVFANGKATNRKLNRPGMEIGAKSTFNFDRNALANHFELVKTEARKGIDKTVIKHPTMLDDEANYSDVMDSILEYLLDTDIECNMGINNVDSRGRAIKSHLDKVMNPIGFKVARALLVIPE
jgi:hypothetical protein